MEITIGEMINYFENVVKNEPEKYFHYRFKNPHSYRGMYDCACVEPCSHPVSAESMLQSLKGLLSDSYFGWKGGEYLYNKDTPLFFADEGTTEAGVGCHDYDMPITEIRQYFKRLIDGGEW